MTAENSAGIAFRPVTVDDIATVVEFRTRMFRELGWRNEELRRRGVARSLMLHAIDCAAEQGAAIVTLHASDLGKPLYERLGFTLTDEMRFFTRNALPSEWGGIQESSD